MSHNINSTHWRESMSTVSTILDANPSTQAHPDVQTVISQIEESLQLSQHALLAHDLPEFEHQTAVQMKLRCVLAGCLQNRISEECDVRARCFGVLHLGRVQLSLLQRAQRSLRVFAHLLALSESGYGSIAECRAPSGKTVALQQEG